MKSTLSKSQFIRGLQCHKSLWLYKNKPELRTSPNDFQRAIFDMGTEIGIYARKLFPGGKVIVYEGSSIQEKVKQTQEHMFQGTKTIYEATFMYDDIIVMVDILHRGDNGWEIYEVKGSTGLKKVYYNDISVQYYVLKELDLPVSDAYLVYLNKEYIRDGDINIQELFCVQRMTRQVKEKRDFLGERLMEIRAMLDGGCPEIDIGTYCFSPYECDFKKHCWKGIPENTVFDLRNRGVDKFEYYNKGVMKFCDIDLDELNVKQRMQVETELSGVPVIKKEKIEEFLGALYYPRFFLDFETFMPPVPLYDGMRPYQPIPFQYSLHMLKNEQAELQYYEFLAEAGSDPRERIIKDLIRLIPANACIVSYNSSYEKMIIKHLAKQFPDYKEKLMEIRGNIQDLMVPFRQRHYYKKEMKGSCSIKFILPALVPELSYKGMAVSGGGEAMNVYARLHLITDKDELEQTRKDLIEYCKLDTLGMVKILEKLKEVCCRSV